MDMHNQEVFAQLLRSQYGKNICASQEIQRFTGLDDQDQYQLVRLQCDDETTWMMQAYHEAYLSRWIFSWTGFASLDDWLFQRTAVLMYLAKRNYAAPQLVFTRSHLPICRDQHWRLLLTSFIPGVTEEYQPLTLSLLGNALGELHQLPLPEEIGPSWWGPGALAQAIATLQCVAETVPASQQQTYHDFLSSLQTVRDADASLPQTLIHGDCWPLNAIRSGNQLTLIDWEFAGRGAALLDLAGLLLMGQCDQNGDLPEGINAARVTAIVQGYAQQRLLSNEELHLLREALRFVIAWRGAMVFARLKTEEWDQRWERVLARAIRGYRLADPITSLATRAFLEHGK